MMDTKETRKQAKETRKQAKIKAIKEKAFLKAEKSLHDFIGAYAEKPKERYIILTSYLKECQSLAVDFIDDYEEIKNGK